MIEIDDTTFEAEIEAAGDQLSPVRANLLFAREVAYPDLRPSDSLIYLDEIALDARLALAARAGVEARGLALADFLFNTLGYQGNRDEYNDPRNSYLNEVLTRRTGLPISLSALYLHIAGRLELPVHGIGMPGHFIVALDGENGRLFIDPFFGGRTLTVDDCADLVTRSTGYRGAFNRRWLAPTPPREIVARMLNNLRNYYVQAQEWALAVRVIERLRELQPDQLEHLRDAGILLYRAGVYSRAAQHLNDYLLRAPTADDAESVRESRDLILDQLAKLN